jgi:hypothetical protein
MWMPRASGFSTLVELTDLHFELLPLAYKISLVSYHKLLTRGTILPERFVVRVDGLEKRSDQPANKNTGQIETSRGYVHGYGTIRHHLSRVHLPPPTLGCRLQLFYPGDHLVHSFLLKQVLGFTQSVDSFVRLEIGGNQSRSPVAIRMAF